MFMLARMSDSVRMAPHLFGGDFGRALERALNRKFANRVVLDVGLCVCFYDFEHVADSFILPGDGASHTKVRFRFVVFRPFVDEILVGRVRSSDSSGVQLTVGFFDDIYVPVDKLPNPSKFEETDQAWYWEYAADDEDDAAPPAKLYLDPGKQVRLRVVEEHFVDTQPAGGATDGDAAAAPADDAKVPYRIIVRVCAHAQPQLRPLQASLSEPGLGCLQWWLES